MRCGRGGVASAAAEQVRCACLWRPLCEGLCSAWRGSLRRWDAAAPEGRAARRKESCEGARGSWGPARAVFCGALQAGGLVGARSAQLPPRSLGGAEPTLNGAFDPCAGSGCESVQGRRHAPGCAGHARCGRRGWRGVARVSVAAMCGAGWAICSCEGRVWTDGGVARRKPPSSVTARRARAVAVVVPPRPPGDDRAGRCVCAPHSPAHFVGCAAREAGAGSGGWERREPARDAPQAAVDRRMCSAVCVRSPGWRRAARLGKRGATASLRTGATSGRKLSVATAQTFIMLAQETCAEVAKPEWWSDEGLKALSARVVRAAPAARLGNQQDAGSGAKWAVWRLGGGASLGGGAQRGGRAL